MRKKLGLILLGSLALFAGTDWSAAGRQWWSHVQFLARDQLQGRNVGSPGFDKAADHVAAEFERAGLGPGGTNHYFQPVQLTEISLIASRSKMAIVRAGTATEVAIPAEAILGYGADSAPSLEAPIVFAGYGLRIPEAHYDDSQGISVRGAVVAY